MHIPYLRQIVGVLAGAALGFVYWRFVGCATGTCLITANPWMSTSYGAILGLLVTW